MRFVNRESRCTAGEPCTNGQPSNIADVWLHPPLPPTVPTRAFDHAFFTTGDSKSISHSGAVAESPTTVPTRCDKKEVKPVVTPESLEFRVSKTDTFAVLQCASGGMSEWASDELGLNGGATDTFQVGRLAGAWERVHAR